MDELCAILLDQLQLGAAFVVVAMRGDGDRVRGLWPVLFLLLLHQGLLRHAPPAAATAAAAAIAIPAPPSQLLPGRLG